MDKAGQYEIELIHPHHNQEKILKTRKRYNVLKCGRRFGKTSLTQYLAAETALHGQYIGIWQPTYKDLHNVWNELKYTLHPITESKNEQVKQLILITGGIIEMWSMEDVNAGRGRKYHRIIIDEAEKSRNLKDIWEQTIRGTLADFQGDAYFFSTPKFGKTFFKELSKKNDDKWAAWKFTTLDNPFILPDEVEEIKQTVPAKVFDCEYMAEDIDTLSENPFFYTFNRDSHYADSEWQPKEKLLYLSFDFNVNPTTCLIGEFDNAKSNGHIFDLILTNQHTISGLSPIESACQLIRKKYIDSGKYANYQIRVTGDASGKAGSADRKEHDSFYATIIKELKLHQQQVVIRKQNLPHSISGRICNTILRLNAIAIYNLPELLSDIQVAYADSDGGLNAAKKEYGLHIVDAFRYLLDLWFVFPEKNISQIESKLLFLSKKHERNN